MGDDGWLGRMGWSTGDLLALVVSGVCLLGCAAWTCGTVAWGCGADSGSSLGLLERLGRALLWEVANLGILVGAVWRLAVLFGPGPFQRALLPIVLVAGGLGAGVRGWALPAWLGHGAGAAAAGPVRRFLAVGLLGQAPCLLALLVIFTLGGELPVLGAAPEGGS